MYKYRLSYIIEFQVIKISFTLAFIEYQADAANALITIMLLTIEFVILKD